MTPKPRNKNMKQQKMFIHWKSLVAFGIIFWGLLCAFDFLGGSPYQGYVYDTRDYNLLYETFYMDKSHYTDVRRDFVPKLQNFGWSLLVWNSVTFLCSVLFCYVLRIFWWIISKSIFVRNSRILATLATVTSSYPRSVNLSKIPVKIKPNLMTSISGTESQIKLVPKVNSCSDVSCLKILCERTKSNLSENISRSTSNCQTFFKINETSTPTKTDGRKVDSYMDNSQLVRLRTEIISIQNNALKEQTELSKKLNSVNKQKKELLKQLAVSQKENRAAKQQIEELAQDKMILVKKLETVNKDVKLYTKSKKVALAKLEEFSNISDNRKQQLEQVTRDKDILESKLRVLQEEYGRLQERIILNGDKHCVNYPENMPERDINSLLNRNIITPERNQNQHPESRIHSVSETDLDMNKIQVKIKQLERNLENFNANKTDINFTDGEAESDLSLSFDETKSKTEDEIDAYDFYFTNSPRLPFWPGRQTEVRIGPFNRTYSSSPKGVHNGSQSTLLGNPQEKVFTDVD